MPKYVRDVLKARPGDELEFEPYEEGSFIVRHRPRRSVLDFAGIAADVADRLPATAEELDELVARGMSERAVREQGTRGQDKSRTRRPGKDG